MTDIAKKHSKARVAILQELLPLLEHDCLSNELINRAESKTSLLVGYHNIIFPGGRAEIASACESLLDSYMLAELGNITQLPLKIREQIALLLEIRIIDIIPKTTMFNICSYFLCPQNLTLGAKSAYRSCDLIWKYVGDRSTDFNYYSKRALLFSAYNCARVFYFNDNSQNHQDTREFIKNSLDNIINIASFKKYIKLPKIEDIPIIRLFS